MRCNDDDCDYESCDVIRAEITRLRQELDDVRGRVKEALDEVTLLSRLVEEAHAQRDEAVAQAAVLVSEMEQTKEMVETEECRQDEDCHHCFIVHELIDPALEQTPAAARKLMDVFKAAQELAEQGYIVRGIGADSERGSKLRDALNALRGEGV